MLKQIYKNLIIKEVTGVFKTPYYVLADEMKAQRHTVKTLSEDVNIKYPTLYNKLSKGSGITVEEALSIKYALGCKMPIEKLFEKRAG
jgi:hypothetical protein